MIAKELLKEILLERQKKLEESMKKDFVARNKLNEIKDLIGIKHCIILTGIRRCGKSVLLTEIMDKFYTKYFYYINFEDERLLKFDVNDFNMLYETCIELFGSKKTFFLDEVQNIAGWERWVRRMYDDGFKFFITGSNAKLLSKELGTLLTGRQVSISLYPFDFYEFLSFHKIDFKKEDIYLTEKRALIIKKFNEYINDGGLPEYLESKRIEVLQDHFNDIIQKDIVERYGIKNIKQLKELANYLITNTGNLSTYNSLKKANNFQSVNTIIKYVSYLENTYLVFTVPYFSYSLRKQAANPFKAYAIDPGLRNAISFTFSRDIGRIYETIVAIELKRAKKEVFYWKNVLHEEVDFVVKKGNKAEQLIQVCYNLNDVNVKKRELNAMIKASDELRCNNLLIITDEHEHEEKIADKKIKFLPLWKWLLIRNE
ncbi:ATP-binding protein [Candidatus Woesearchaeota archaeon]|nr:ATP-binding protein [Candidatus Woesearchaeota archaeon]